ncbi:MAG TPA: hypothetical protein VII14_03515, partial [Xanthobacteraceae bacterium]
EGKAEEVPGMTVGDRHCEDKAQRPHRLRFRLDASAPAANSVSSSLPALTGLDPAIQPLHQDSSLAKSWMRVNPRIKSGDAHDGAEAPLKSTPDRKITPLVR